MNLISSSQKNASAAGRGLMTAAHYSKLEALMSEAAQDARFDALEATSHAAATVASSPAGWLSIVGQALTFALVAAGAAVDGVINQVAQTLTGAKRGAVVSLTSSGAAVAVNLALANNFAHALTENTTLGTPTNPVAGQSGVIVFTQHASSAKTLGFNSFWKFAGGNVPVLSTSLGAVDTFAYYVESATRATCSLVKDVR